MESNETPQDKPSQGTPETQASAEQEQRTEKALGAVLRIAGQPNTPLERQRLAKAYSTAQAITSAFQEEGEESQLQQPSESTQQQESPAPQDTAQLAERVFEAANKSQKEYQAALVNFYAAKIAEFRQMPRTPENILLRSSFEQLAVGTAQNMKREGASKQSGNLQVSYTDLPKRNL